MTNRTKPLMVVGLTVLVLAGLWVHTRLAHQRANRVTPVPTTVPGVASNVLLALKQPLPLGNRSTPPSVYPIWGWEKEPFEVRLSAVRSLGRNLKREEVEALYDYLRSSGDHVLKNRILNTLHNQVAVPPDLVEVMQALFRDRKQDVVTRDYALQHLVTFCQQTQFRGGTSQHLYLPLWEGLQETGSSIAGTALLGLHNLSRQDQTISAPGVDEAALKLLQDPAAGQLSRITALQVCSQRRLADALSLAKEWARQGETLSVRLSAIAALGHLGGAAEKEFLGRLKKEDNKNIQPAILSALRRLELSVPDPAINAKSLGRK